MPAMVTCTQNETPCTEDPAGATMYVTLEPCCHHGKQPPCTEALVESGIRRGYIGSRDFNPLVFGKGVQYLEEHGIEVIPDFLREACDKLNPIFFRYIDTKMPYTILKYAMTADGKIACAGGASKWVTGEAARAHVQQTRKRVAAICVGIGTVLADDPLLTCRCENPSQPVRVVLDTRLRIPMESRLVQTAKEVPVIVFCYAPDKDKKAALEAAGVTVLEAKLLPKEELDELFMRLGEFQLSKEELNGRHISLRNCLEQLGQRGLDSVLIEVRPFTPQHCRKIAVIWCRFTWHRSCSAATVCPPLAAWALPHRTRLSCCPNPPLPVWDRICFWNIPERSNSKMFTGIVEEMGTVRRLNQSPNRCELELSAAKVLEGTQIGDSIAVNGVCLTVIRMDKDHFTADVMPETLRRSNLGQLKTGSKVNLERAMAADGRFGGHIVAGHIDGTGRIRSMQPEGNAVLVTISAAPELLRYVVEKGSIAIDGISLTVAKVSHTDFTVSLIPHTGEETTLLKHRSGEIVNLETDIIGKYVEKLMQPKSGGVTMELLQQNGFF